MINFEGKFIRSFDPRIKLQVSGKTIFELAWSKFNDAPEEE